MHQSFKFIFFVFVSACCFMVTDSFAASWACSHSECAFCSDDRAFCKNDGTCFCVEPGCGCTKEECYCPDDDEAWGMNGRGEWGCYNRCFDGLDAGECLKKCRCDGQPDGTDWICSKTGEWIWNYSCNAKEIINSTQEQCATCKQRFWHDGKCYPDESWYKEEIEKNPCVKDMNSCECNPKQCKCAEYAEDNPCLCDESYASENPCICNPDCSCPTYAEEHTCECKYWDHWYCDCPENGEAFGTTSNFACCKGTWAWDGSSYSILNPLICGCPEGGKPSGDGTTCCKGDKSWDGSSYSDLNPSVCGCPEGKTLSFSGNTCCDVNSTDRCECDPEYAKENSCICQGETSCACNPNQCGCEDYYKNNLCECEPKYKVEHVCECLPEDQRTEENCMCPDGGDLIWDDSGEHHCCKWNYEWDGSGYSKFSPVCGCPDGGTPSEDGTTCCKGVYYWNGSDYVWPVGYHSHCGGLPGMTKGTNGTTYCYGNNFVVQWQSGGTWRYWSPAGSLRTNPDICGCPYGSKQIDSVHCQNADGGCYDGHDNLFSGSCTGSSPYGYTKI